MNDWDFKELRAKLDIMGFNQTLPVLAIPLVKAIFGDLIKTTECLRDTKKQLGDLLEEKSCWELGVEPYKCDNTRLIAECNALHMQVLKEREDYELRMCEAERRIRNLQTDSEHLQKHNQQLQNELDAFVTKHQFNPVKPTTLRQTKKPFISTVRCGAMPTASAPSTISSLKCTKCNAGVIQKTTTINKDGVAVAHTSAPEEINRLKNELTSMGEQLEFYKRKVEARNREIRRLNDMLSGGRPPAALAKDCCYKEVGALSKDICNLQREKCELMGQVSEYQNKMHDAMQRAIRIEEEKRKLQLHLCELKEAALQVEQQANCEIDAKDTELRQLRTQLDKVQQCNDKKPKGHRLAGGHEKSPIHNDKRMLNEKLNLLTRQEEELRTENAKLKRKLTKMESKLAAVEKELREQMQQSSVTLDEEKIRLKSERDFFQKEYLRLIGKTGSDSEIAFLHAQIKSKDDELHALRSELCKASSLKVSPRKSGHCDNQSPYTAGNSYGNTNSSDCVQAVIARVERERDCARVELERLRCERDTLREKQLSSVQMHAEELQALRLRNEDLQERLRQLERDYRELNSARVPTETHCALLKEDVSELKQRVAALQTEADNLRRENDQITLLNEQNERLLADYQSKLLIAERQLQRADVRASTLDSSRETNRNEVSNLRGEIAALRQTFVALENEKESLLNQLDRKTERVIQLEYEMKDSKEKRNLLEQTVKELQSRVDKLTTRTRQCDSELFETSAESKTLRQQIVALKNSRDEAIVENGRLTDKLSNVQVEANMLRQKLKDAEQQVDDMKKKLHKYVQEVKRAEDLLMDKEKERDELLEQYHSLTNDQVTLAGNNKSLKDEAAEFKSQICELMCEISSLKNELCCRQCKIEELEMQLTAARASVRCLERELEVAREHKIELDVRKELCDKLDNEKDMLNAELNELNEIRKKLEREVEQLRAELQQKSELNRVTTETTEGMLVRIRGEHQRQDEAERSAKLELERLRKSLADTMVELQKERERCNKQERLANQYEEQARELRKNLADDRFCQARTREVSPRMKSPTSL